MQQMRLLPKETRTKRAWPQGTEEEWQRHLRTAWKLKSKKEIMSEFRSSLEQHSCETKLRFFFKAKRQMISCWVAGFCFKFGKVGERSWKHKVSCASSNSAASGAPVGNWVNLVTSAWALALQRAWLLDWWKPPFAGRRNTILPGYNRHRRRASLQLPMAAHILRETKACAKRVSPRHNVLAPGPNTHPCVQGQSCPTTAAQARGC